MGLLGAMLGAQLGALWLEPEFYSYPIYKSFTLENVCFA
jgi:hypothetical protein